jgi:hypothetical protein
VVLAVYLALREAYVKRDGGDRGGVVVVPSIRVGRPPHHLALHMQGEVGLAAHLALREASVTLHAGDRRGAAVVPGI